MRWIEATPKQREAIVARSEREKEAKIRRPEYQAELRACIAFLCTQIVEKQELALAEPSIARRLDRQIGDLEEELEFYLKEQRTPTGEPIVNTQKFSAQRVVDEHASNDHHLHFMLDIASKQAITLQMTMMKARNFTNIVEEKIVDLLIEDIHNLTISITALKDVIGDGQ